MLDSDTQSLTMADALPDMLRFGSGYGQDDPFSLDAVIDDILSCTATEERIESVSDMKSEISIDCDPDLDAIISTPVESRVINERTIYGGYRVSLATEARNLAVKVNEGTAATADYTKGKEAHVRKWEYLFGKHTARCHPMSILELIREEGKPTIFLITLGISVSVIDYAIGLAVMALTLLKQLMHASLHNFIEGYWISDYSSIIVSIFSVVILTVASTAWTRIVDPIAAGSGIPEMKAILSGDLRRELDRYLQAKTLLSKTVGLVCSLSSGISIGKEGPFVHTACIACHQLMGRIPYFNSLLDNKSIHRHMYCAACAVGVASTFAAPIGGLLFSIEVTSTFYLVSTYWRGFVAAVSGAIAMQFMELAMPLKQRGSPFETLFPTSFPSSGLFTHFELLAFAFIGVIMGCIGPAYIHLSDKVRLAFYRFNHSHPLSWSAFIASIIGILLFFPGKYGELEFGSLVQDLCLPSELPKIWTSYSIFLLLPFSALCRIFATVFSVALPIPAGDFMPLFVIGAMIGRWIGELFLYAFPDSGIIPGGYALVGATALVGSVTHTMSAAVIALEFTGQLNYILPIFLSVMIACGLSQALSCSIYDCVLMRKGLPYLPLLRFDRFSDVRAKDIMNKKLRYLTVDTSYEQIKSVLRNSFFTRYPVVEISNGMMLHGCIQRDDLIGILKELKSRTIDPSPLDRYTTQKNLCEFYSVPGDVFVTPKRDIGAEPGAINLLAWPGIKLDRSPLQIDEYTPAEEVHILFEMMRCSMLFVNSHGYLVGVISRRSLYFRLHYVGSGSRSITG